MNNVNRKELARALALIQEALEIVSAVRDDENEKFENLSEGLQASEKGQKFEEVVAALDECLSYFEECETLINSASE